MSWLVFSYSLPSKANANARVRLWRKLRRLGAVSPKSGVHILPDSPESLENLKWMTMEVEEAKGDALIMKVEKFENLSDQQLIELFRQERTQDYIEIEALLKQMENQSGTSDEKTTALQRNIKKLRKSIEEIARIDFFQAGNKPFLTNRLQTLQKSLLTGNLILMVMFSIGTLNTVVLRKMKQESNLIPRKETIAIKRTDGLLH